jgi:hypothetical protein
VASQRKLHPCALMIRCRLCGIEPQHPDLRICSWPNISLAAIIHDVCIPVALFSKATAANDRLEGTVLIYCTEMVSPLEEYERLGVPKISVPVIYGALLGDDLIEQFEGYRRKRCDSQTNTNTTNTKDDLPVLFIDVTIGRILTGHEGIVHGGIITFLFDEAMAWGHAVIREGPSECVLPSTLFVLRSRRRLISIGTCVLFFSTSLLDSELLESKVFPAITAMLLLSVEEF